MSGGWTGRPSRRLIRVTEMSKVCGLDKDNGKVNRRAAEQAWTCTWKFSGEGLRGEGVSPFPSTFHYSNSPKRCLH